MEQLEQEVIELLLCGNDPVLNTLRFQSRNSPRTREMTGAGFFTSFSVPGELLRLVGSPSFTFGDVVAEITGLKLGAGFVKFIEAGALKMLEGYSDDEEWPPTIEKNKVAYVSGGQRDLRSLHALPGWPRS